MANKKNYDIVIIGGGPGGYPAAIRAASRGLKTALIEAGDLGGTCLNRGCIPSKAMIASAEFYSRLADAAALGINISGTVTIDYAKMVKRKDEVVTHIRKSLEGLIVANGVDILRGKGTIISRNEIEIKGKDQGIIQTQKIIIATGSEPRSIPTFPFDHESILDSTDLLNRTILPKKVLIVGGGVIGCEFASLFSLLNVDVTVVEMLPSILPMEAEVVSSHLAKVFRKRGVKIETSAKVEKIEKTSSGVKAYLASQKSFEAEIALIAVGRKMNLEGIGLEKIGVKLKDPSQIQVNGHMETNVPGVYAVGDIASPWWLAHVATHQGLVAADHAAGIETEMHYNAVPNVIFTHPEIATVGFSLEKAREKGYPAVAGQFPFQALGKAQAALHTDGFAQIVIDETTGQILGAQIIGYEASSLIGEMALAIQNELTVECIHQTIHAHPTMAEAWLESALLASGIPVHYPPKAKR